MVRGVCLLDTDSHELLDARLGTYHCGELTLAAGLHGLDHSITLFDRAYFSAAFLLDWQARLVQVSTPDGQVRRFITSMLDPERFVATELAQLYRQCAAQQTA